MGNGGGVIAGYGWEICCEDNVGAAWGAGNVGSVGKAGALWDGWDDGGMTNGRVWNWRFSDMADTLQHKLFRVRLQEIEKHVNIECAFQV
jgi:hypothetical protein